MKFHRALGIMMFLSGSLAACAGGISDIVIELDPSQGRPCGHWHMQRLPRIEVIDIRKDQAMERTTVGGLSLGRVDLHPPESALVRNIIENSLCNLFADKPEPAEIPVIYCGIRTFDISTPATPLYWDVVAKVELVLRVQGKDHPVSGSARERTWIWPSRDIIHRVADEALRQVTLELDKSLKLIF